MFFFHLFFFFFFFFFFNDTATTEIYTLSLHDALPISEALEHLQQDRLHVSQPEGHLRRVEDSRQLQLGQPLLRQRRLLRRLFVERPHHPQLGHPGDGGRDHRARSRVWSRA